MAEERGVTGNDGTRAVGMNWRWARYNPLVRLYYRLFVTVSHFRAVQLSFEVTVTQEPPALCSEPDYIVGKALKSSHWVPNEANANWDLSLCIVHRTLLFYIYNC